MTTKATRPTEALIPVELIERKIYLIRGYKVMLDRDLADLYQVETPYLNRQVKRNVERFPADFLFQLNDEEAEALRCQFGISNAGGRGGRRYLPYAFTQEACCLVY
ncbi:MAG: ORF6N domain-containing protein [Pyrinomonadaceae bacterium]